MTRSTSTEHVTCEALAFFPVDTHWVSMGSEEGLGNKEGWSGLRPDGRREAVV